MNTILTNYHAFLLLQGNSTNCDSSLFLNVAWCMKMWVGWAHNNVMNVVNNKLIVYYFLTPDTTNTMNNTNISVSYPVLLWSVMNGVDVSIIRCDCVTDLGGVSRTHVIDSTTIVFKKITYHGKVVVSVIGDDASDTGDISVSDLSYISIRP